MAEFAWGRLAGHSRGEGRGLAQVLGGDSKTNAGHHHHLMAPKVHTPLGRSGQSHTNTALNVHVSRWGARAQTRYITAFTECTADTHHVERLEGMDRWLPDIPRRGRGLADSGLLRWRCLQCLGPSMSRVAEGGRLTSIAFLALCCSARTESVSHRAPLGLARASSSCFSSSIRTRLTRSIPCRM